LVGYHLIAEGSLQIYPWVRTSQTALRELNLSISRESEKFVGDQGRKIRINIDDSSP
jgi:hypothetical protein